MLKTLSISDYVIISELTVEFFSGLTVITGETGAGKSILLDALGLILGDDPDVDSIRQKQEAATIEALFEQPATHPVWAFLSARPEFKSIVPPNLRIKRVMSRNGADTITINDVSADLVFLKELGTFLAEIHGQNANQTFLAPQSQLSLVDAFGAYPPHLMESVAQAWNDIGLISTELEEEKIFFARADRERPEIERVVAAIEKTGLKKGMYVELKTRLAHLIETRSICELFQSMNAQLIAQTGIEMSLSRIDRLLGTQKDSDLDKLKSHVRLALDETKAAILEMQVLSPKYLDVDTSSIRDLEKAIEDIKAIAAEREKPPEELFDHYVYLADRLARIKGAPAKIKAFDEKLIAANEKYRALATTLSQERKKTAQKLSSEITSEMPPLKLPSAQIQVDVTEHPNERTAKGFNQVSFTARMNPGTPFSPIAKTASGGELSRLILAVKMILQQVQAVSTLVFDEIDSGIGGAAAAAVGSRISKLAATTQILVITHSPQVASRGDQHLHVSKKTDGTTTKTVTTVLSIEKRIEEVSRMLAGEAITDQSMAAAKTLIEEARAASEARKAASAG